MRLEVDWLSAEMGDIDTDESELTACNDDTDGEVECRRVVDDTLVDDGDDVNVNVGNVPKNQAPDFFHIWC